MKRNDVLETRSVFGPSAAGAGVVAAGGALVFPTATAGGGAPGMFYILGVFCVLVPAFALAGVALGVLAWCFEESWQRKFGVAGIVLSTMTLIGGAVTTVQIFA